MCLPPSYGFQASHTQIYQIFAIVLIEAGESIQGTNCNCITEITFVLKQEAGYPTPRREEDTKTSFRAYCSVCLLALSMVSMSTYRNWN